MLVRFARLAARAAGTRCAFIGGVDAKTAVIASYGLDRHPAARAWLQSVCAEPGFVEGDGPAHWLNREWRSSGSVHLPFFVLLPIPLLHPPLGPVAGWPQGGFLCVADIEKRPALGQAQMLLLGDVAGLASQALEWEQRHRQLLQITTQAARADRMLRQVSEAESCTDALTSMLGELCHHHGALVGRIWRLTDDSMMQEVSRFMSGDDQERQAYYQAQPTEPVRAGNSKTAEAIRTNRPLAFLYSQVTNVEQYALMGAAVAAGLASQVSYPVWVQEQRFGVSLAFTTERPDLDAVVADIGSFANSIRPALFRKVAEDRIRYMAHHDELTQLGNRTVLNERLLAAIAQGAATEGTGRGIGPNTGSTIMGASTGPCTLALLYLDLDGFKKVNDSRGHEVGDKLLAAVASRLRANVREGDTIARIGGDEFAILHWGAEQPHAATQLARRLLQTIAQPFEIDGQPSTIGISIGIALYPGDGRTPDVLQRHADAALYEAKQAGKNTFRLFETSAGVMQRERSEMERDLRRSIEANGLSLAYQPIVATTLQTVVGMEALLRWSHPARGELAPSDFVSMAEASGLIVPLGRWVLQAACAEASTWRRPALLSINVSPTQLRQAGFPREIDGVLASTGLPAERLDLEITEGSLLDDAVMRTMHALRELGVRLSLNEFGQAFSGLSTLRRFPFGRIKIGTAFVRDMVEDRAALAIVQAIVGLGGQLGLDVVAQGVETEEQLALLQQLGCPLVQGFLAGRPVGPDEAAEVVASGIVPGQVVAGQHAG